MSAKTPGSCNSVLLVPPSSAKSKSRNLDLCLICQHVKDVKGSSQLSSTEAGRKVVIDASEKLQDGFLNGIDPTKLTEIKYHTKSCYATYRLKGQRVKPDAAKRKSEHEADSDPSLTSPTGSSRPKRTKATTPPDIKNKPCIICNHIKCQGVLEKSRVETYDVAERLLKAVNFNKDDVYTRLVFMQEIGDVFAADVMYHKKCMNKYIKQFQRDVEKLMEVDFDNEGNEDVVIKEFNELVSTLDIKTTGYAVSDVRDMLNMKLMVHGTS